jgi:hypothetical protein
MALTYEPIATTTTNGGTNSISFTSLPTTYTDLRIVVQYPTGFVSGGDWYVTINNDDTSTNYYSVYPYAATGQTPNPQWGYTNRWLYFSNAGGMYLTTFFGWVDIPSYQMNAGKPHMVGYGGCQALSAVTGTVQWNYGLANAVTGAVTSVQIRKVGGAFSGTGCVITLFGIKAA